MLVVARQHGGLKCADGGDDEARARGIPVEDCLRKRGVRVKDVSKCGSESGARGALWSTHGVNVLLQHLVERF